MEKEEIIKKLEEQKIHHGRWQGTKAQKKMLERVEKLMKKVEVKNLNFSHEAKPLRVTEEAGNIVNVATTIKKEIFNEIPGCGSIWYRQTIVNGTDILLSSGCAVTALEPKWQKEMLRILKI